MRKLTFTNSKGERVVFGPNPPYIMNKVSGLGDTDSERQTVRSYGQDGATPVDILLEERDIAIEFSYKGKTLEEIAFHRKRLAAIMNPKLGQGELKYEDDNNTYIIYVDVDHLPTADEQQFKFIQSSVVQFIAPDPYWLDPVKVSRSLRAYEGKFTFPFTFPVQFGIEGDVTTVKNDGDTSAPVVITIQGPLRRPMIENRTTGEFIRINAAISPEEVLYIDTNPKAKRVEIHRGNQIIKAMGYMDHLSDFWQLKDGDNELRYTADEGIAEAIAAISWHNKYVGI
ncbi:phage tail domain-containing protein [Evansella clarkii]|uniref:phage tail domain-containing protein n=1 Tax=Evansella clarkii TaxID=79879 RepID=UPI0009960708|nr:phage tail domain-containing protein [Evansella clarkii]